MTFFTLLFTAIVGGFGLIVGGTIGLIFILWFTVKLAKWLFADALNNK